MAEKKTQDTNSVREGVIAELVLDERNANLGTERGRYALQESLAQLGLGRSIVVDKNGKVIGGNKTVETAVDLGFTQTTVVPTDGRTLVVVQRTDLDLDNDDGRARLLAYADNRVAELDLNFDAEVMVVDLESGVDLTRFWTPVELEDLVGDFLEGDAEPTVDFAEFGNNQFKDASDDGYTNFAFGRYRGRVGNDVYESFIQAYQEHQLDSGEVMLDDVLRSWLNV